MAKTGIKKLIYIVVAYLLCLLSLETTDTLVKLLLHYDFKCVSVCLTGNMHIKLKVSIWKKKHKLKRLMWVDRAFNEDNRKDC